MQEEGEDVLHQLELGPSKFQLVGSELLIMFSSRFNLPQVVMCENLRCDWPFKDVNGSVILKKVEFSFLAYLLIHNHEN